MGSNDLNYQTENYDMRMIDTNIGRMPIEDYREIVAIQNGFDSYEDMRRQGVCLGDDMDEDISEAKRSVRERLAQKAEDPDINVNVKERRHKGMTR